jgi:hypothetical protein
MNQTEIQARVRLHVARGMCLTSDASKPLRAPSKVAGAQIFCCRGEIIYHLFPCWVAILTVLYEPDGVAASGQVSGLMCSLNAVNGVPACADSWLLNKVARQDWGFEGYVTTDCDGYQQSYQFHNYSTSSELGVRDMLRVSNNFRFVQATCEAQPHVLIRPFDLGR